jgi:putative oxidoreductase
MKKIFSVQHHPTSIDIALLVARVGIGLLMLSHGLPKLQTLLSGEPVQFLPVFGLSAQISMWLAVFAEVFCSILLIVGLGTRLATLPLIVTMLVALISVHGADELAKQEPAFHYLLVYVVLLLAGAGKYSVDAWLSKTTSRNYVVQGQKNRSLSTVQS